MLSHPLVVHAPLVFLPTAIIICLIGWVSPWKQLKIAGVALLLAASVTGVLAANTGEEEEERVEDRQPWAEEIGATGLVQTFGGDELLEAHAELGEMTRNLALLLTAAGIALLVVERRAPAVAAKLDKPAVALLSVVGAVTIGVVVLTGHSGGALVHDYGVGIFATPPAATSTGDDEDEDEDEEKESGMVMPAHAVRG